MCYLSMQLFVDVSNTLAVLCEGKALLLFLCDTSKCSFEALPEELFGYVSGFSCKSLSKLQNDGQMEKALANRVQETQTFLETVLHR